MRNKKKLTAESVKKPRVKTGVRVGPQGDGH